MNYSKIIQEIVQKETANLKHIADVGCTAIHNFEINCSKLEDYNSYDIRESPEYEEFFRRLTEITNPVLYIFEIVSDTTSKNIVDGITDYALTENSKKIPAIKRNYPDNKVLYVGKSQKVLWGRIIIHLGFYQKQGTQGLQLFYWAKQLNLVLNLKVLEFERESDSLLPLLERNMAARLKPILGLYQ